MPPAQAHEVHCEGTLAITLVMEPGGRNLLPQFGFTANCSVWENSINKSSLNASHEEEKAI